MHGPSPEVLSSLWLVFLGGIASSAHCLGMCGPLVSMAEGLRPGKWKAWSQLPMHFGRLITYSLLGVISGLFGFAIKRGGETAGILGVASVVGGILMIFLAVALLGWLPGKRVVQVSEKFVAQFANRLASDRPLAGVTLGLYWGLLPCGLVWAWMGAAAGTGSIFNGAIVMFVFGLGTMPALLVIGGLGGLIGHRFRGLLNSIGAITVLLMGAILILRGLSSAGVIGKIMLAPGVPLY